jgi:hypothetical protein
LQGWRVSWAPPSFINFDIKCMNEGVANETPRSDENL